LGAAHKQALHILVGLCLMGCASRLDLERISWKMLGPGYLATSLVLVAVLLPGVGRTVNGSQRWLSLGPLGVVQPSEFAKLILILCLARLFSPRESGLRWLPRLAIGAVLTGTLFALVARQPDLGTALVLGAIFLGMSWIAGFPWWILLSGSLCAAAAVPMFLKTYQRSRLLIFRHPELDPKGLGYHLLQSKLTIGSGSVWGQGLGHGAMTQNGFVPENWTDFVFTVIGEELGLVGGLGLLVLFLGLSLSIAARSALNPGRTGGLIGCGVLAMLAFQFMVNLAMTVGLAPVVGIPLPFCSYGGSAMVMNLLAVGLVLARPRATAAAFSDTA
jgi:rod shape determining protein RodA